MFIPPGNIDGQVAVFEIYNFIRKTLSRTIASIMLSLLELLRDVSSVLDFLFLFHLAEVANGAEQKDSSKRRRSKWHHEKDSSERQR